MIRIVTRAASLAALVLAAGLSHAQGLLTVPKFALMIDRSVRAELKITPVQNQKVDAVLKEVMGEGGGRITIRPGQNLSSLDKGVERVLTAPQRKRFYEIWLQRSGPLALTDAAVAKAVGITPKQKGQIEEIGQEMRDAMRAQATGQGGGRVRSREIRDKANRKIEALLTASQRTRWAKLQGKPFAGVRMR